MRRGILIGAFGVIVVAAVAAIGSGLVSLGGPGSVGAADLESGAPPETATIERRTLEIDDEVDGTLGYDGAFEVTGGPGGTVTRLPEIGAVLERGDRVVELDGGATSAVLLYGLRPAWRTLGPDIDDGLDVLQLDEPAFNVYLDDVKAWGIEALHVAIAGLACRTAVHICYGYGIKANIDWKATLGGQWRQYEATFPLLAASRIDQVSLECAGSRVPLGLLGLLRGKDVLAGAVDVATDRIETPEEVSATIRKALAHVPAERLYPCTNCGMVPLAREVARGKLRALAAGAALVRRELGAA